MNKVDKMRMKMVLSSIGMKLLSSQSQPSSSRTTPAPGRDNVYSSHHSNEGRRHQEDSGGDRSRSRSFNDSSHDDDYRFKSRDCSGAGSSHHGRRYQDNYEVREKSSSRGSREDSSHYGRRYEDNYGARG